LASLHACGKQRARDRLQTGRQSEHDMRQSSEWWNRSTARRSDRFLDRRSPMTINNKLILGDTSPVSPSIAICNGKLYLAWKGDGNDNLNVMVSTDAGASFGNKNTSPETSDDAPALASADSALFIAWKGSDNANLNVATVALDPVSGAPTGIINKVILGDTSPVRPALAVLNGNVYLAWKGDGNDNLNVMVSTDAGASFGNKKTLPETSPVAPTLGTDDGSLFIGWKGDGNDNLNVAVVDIDESTGAPTGLSDKATLGDTSPLNPALAGLSGNLFIGWKGDGNDNLNLMFSADDGQTFADKLTSAETSSDAPALASDGSMLFIAWKGDGNDNLNVARVTTISLFIGRGEFTFTGAGWVPGTTVQVTSDYVNATSDFPGQYGPYSVAADGMFRDTIPVNYFGSAGRLFVEAKDGASGQSASANAPNLGG